MFSFFRNILVQSVYESIERFHLGCKGVIIVSVWSQQSQGNTQPVFYFTILDDVIQQTQSNDSYSPLQLLSVARRQTQTRSR